MIELLSPAGSPESVEAAVQQGASAIYLGYGDFNARRNAKNFTLEEIRETLDYCHIRGVNVFLTLNTLLTQRELPQMAEQIAPVISAGIDAVIVQDLGVASVLKQIAPQLPLHASTQCTVHSLSGVEQVAKLGFSRVVLSRELSYDEIAFIAQRSPIELEVFVHGAMCMSYSGQCYLSAMVGERSGNRGLCAQPCRLSYRWAGEQKHKESHPLSLKDMSLAGHLKQLSALGVACLKIEGRMKRPEYVGIVTKIYASALREGREPSPQEYKALEMAFSRQGFTQGYFENRLGKNMFGTRQNQAEPKDFFTAARQEYHGKERTKITVDVDLKLDAKQLQLICTDPEGNTTQGRISSVEIAQNKPLTPESLVAQLQRTGGTPYHLEPRKLEVEQGLALPLAKVNQLRRELLEDLSKQRSENRRYPQEILPFPTLETPPKREGSQKLAWTIFVKEEGQLSSELLALKPELCYIPVDTSSEKVKLCQKMGVNLCLQLPAILGDGERGELLQQIRRMQSLGVTEGLVGSLDSFQWAKSLGLSLRGDYGLGIYNNFTIAQLEKQGTPLSLMPSFELKFPQIRDLQKSSPMELLVYGNLPLMITKHGLAKGISGNDKPEADTLIDRKGMQFPVETCHGNRSQIYNGLPLFLADKKKDFAELGLWAGRLLFTRESPSQCVHIFQEYQQGTDHPPEQFTRGLYYRGVE